MRLRIILAGLIALLSATASLAQIAGDVMGVHNLGPGSKSPITGARHDFCSYCHAPHSGLNIGLWNQRLSTQTYAMYLSDTETNRGKQPLLGSVSNQCLSCHDGTVAVGATVAYGQVTTKGSMTSTDVLGSHMQSSHPFSLKTPLKDNVDLVASIVASGKTEDTTGAVKLIGGNVECTSCHNPHVQAKDVISQNFLVKDSSNGQMCLACHDPTRQMSGQVNPLADWPTSAHAISPAKIAPQAKLGSYTTVAADACISCHEPHNARAPRLLRGPNEGDCISCHNGGTNISPSLAKVNVFSEYVSGKVGHPFPSSTNLHDAAENTLLNNNRHATCVDCHNGHAAAEVTVFPPPPLMRPSQRDIAGINASDGTSILTPAVNQYENCLRCHGSSTGKQVLPIYGYAPVRAVSYSDSQNIIPQFTTLNVSSHPVMHTSISGRVQPSLRSTMLDLYGAANGRTMGNQILCTDCHNSDDNRESGGAGPNGPHGSRWFHILERRYEFSTAAMPGQLATNLFPTPSLVVGGPFDLCAKCHDLAVVLNQQGNNTSWSGHTNHVWTDGLSCSTCHTAHGLGATSATISGERLVDFDLNVVAPNPNSGMPISYQRATNSCVLQCHLYNHNVGGSVTPASVGRGPGILRK